MGPCYKSIAFLTLLHFVFFMNQIAVSYPMDDSSNVTLGSLGKKKLEQIYKVIGQENNIKEATTIFDLMSAPWSEYSREIKWENNLTDDFSPFEYSITFKGSKTTPIIRFLIEPQEFPLNKQSNWKAGLALKERIKKLPNVDVSKLNKIQNIFSPPTTQNIESHFSIWYAAVLEPNNPQIKVYLNPQIRGEKSAPELVKNAFVALDSEHAWKFISDRLSLSKNPSKMLYFSLDLSADDKARTKVYVANNSLKDIEAQLQGCLHYVPGSASKWVKILTNQDFFDKKPIQITYNFTSEHDRP
ncbi:MAG TPA: tryptophan dimethylallyltransferase family protein, partial [Alphaproteobacteria bacterium]|nr:tryptophan dimethylallyltransferase family protein [Alphaproteobacteria bacterium]